MNRDSPTNVAASVRQRLLNFSRARGEPFQSVLTRFAMERLLYRLSRSSGVDRYLLKGALLFRLWLEHPHRATRDIDLLGFGVPSVKAQIDLFRSLCSLPVEADGMEFSADTVTASEIREDNIYGGVRLLLSAHLESARIPMQIDVGFGDSVTPPATEANFPVILDFPAPRLRVYPPEATIAEKLHALVVLDMGNSRMKDLFDLYTLGSQFAFTAERLGSAIRATFGSRGTPLPPGPPTAMTGVFSADSAKKAQWNAFIRRQHLTQEELPLAEVVSFLYAFLWPILADLQGGESLAGAWRPGGPWHVPGETGDIPAD